MKVTFGFLCRIKLTHDLQSPTSPFALVLGLGPVLGLPLPFFLLKSLSTLCWYLCTLCINSMHSILIPKRVKVLCFQRSGQRIQQAKKSWLIIYLKNIFFLVAQRIENDLYVNVYMMKRTTNTHTHTHKLRLLTEVCKVEAMDLTLCLGENKQKIEILY